MNNSKKTLLLMLIPVALTLYFIVRIFFPAVESYLNLREQYIQTLDTYKQTQESVEELKDNKKLFVELEKLNNQVADFEIQIPSEFQDEFFLIDIENFSINTGTKIIALDCRKEKELEIKDPQEEKNKEKSKKSTQKKKKKNSKEKQVSPLAIWEKPFEVKIVGHYKQALGFVNLLENYQRKFIINGISAKISKSDENNPNPKIELTIQGSTYKKVETVVEEPAPEEPKDPEQKSEKG